MVLPPLPLYFSSSYYHVPLSLWACTPTARTSRRTDAKRPNPPLFAYKTLHRYRKLKAAPVNNHIHRVTEIVSSLTNILLTLRKEIF